MEFENWMWQGRTSPAKTTNRWLDPSADPIALDAVIQSGILKNEALAKAQREKEEKDAALLSQVESGLITPTVTTKDTTDDTTSTKTTTDDTTPTPTTSTQTLEDFYAFEKRFEGLAGLDELKAAIEAGTYTGVALEDITPSFFNDMVADASVFCPVAGVLKLDFIVRQVVIMLKLI